MAQCRTHKSDRGNKWVKLFFTATKEAYDDYSAHWVSQDLDGGPGMPYRRNRKCSGPQ